MPDTILTVQGRSIIVHKPDGPGPFPLILAFHGGGGNNQKLRDGALFERYTDPARFAIAYPNGTPGTDSTQRTPQEMRDGPMDPKNPVNLGPDHLYFNAGRCFGNADEESFTESTLFEIAKDTSIDTSRVCLTGISDGAMLCYALAQMLPGRFKAIAPIAGDNQYHQRQWAPVPVFHVHGKMDQREPWDAHSIPPYNVPHDLPIPQFISSIAIANEALSVPSATGGFGRNLWLLHQWLGGKETCLLEIPFGGHNIPGGAMIPPVVAIMERLTPQTQVEAGRMIVAFFKRHV